MLYMVSIVHFGGYDVGVCGICNTVNENGTFEKNIYISATLVASYPLAMVSSLLRMVLQELAGS